VAFSPDGRRLATVGGHIAVHPDREIKIWDAHTGQKIRSLRGHVGGLRSVAFSPDGRRLASCGLDQTIKLWDTASWEEVLTLRGHVDNAFCVAFSADGRQLASSSVDKTVRIWDATPLERDPTPEHLTLHGHAGAVTDVAFHPTDGRSLVSAGADGTIQVWNARSGEKLDTLHVSPTAYGVRVAYSPDGRRLAVISGESARAAVTIWDTATAKRTDSFPGQTAQDMCVAFSPDGRHVASAGMASASMASASMDFDVRVREATTGKLLSVVPNHKWPINGVAFSPDGRFLASGSNDSTVRICDWKTGEQLPTLRPHFAARVAGVVFSPDGQWLAAASWDRTIKVWKTSTWELLHDLPDPTGAALCVAFGPDRRLVWGGTDGTVKVWDGSDAELQVLRGHTSWVQAVSVSADGTQIASASLDGTAKIWPAPPSPKAPGPEAEAQESR
jgi:WD40 repeat protein